MNVAVIGSGGREHALVKALYNSSSVKQVHAYPGSPGMKDLSKCHDISWKNYEALKSSFEDQKISLVVIGPEQPLVDGLADHLRQDGFSVFGPDQKAAQLEGSKIFCKQFMLEAGLPTAKYKSVKTYEESVKVADDFDFPLVLKADGLAAGKGVYICHKQEDLIRASEDIFKKQIFGSTEALVEEFLQGWELSYIVITDGEKYEVCPLAQDHKTLLDGGMGPNTGGMGVHGPVEIDKDLDDKIREQIVQPSLDQLKKLRLSYKGALFIGLMIKDSKPYVLEFNVRFGDPETQIIMPLLDADVGEVLKSCADGDLKGFDIKDQYAACVVLAAPGYPQEVQKGAMIHGEISFEQEESYFIHAGAGQRPSGEFFVNGGRVLGAVGLGENKDQAINQAYKQAEKVRWDGMQYRSDIGTYFDLK